MINEIIIQCVREALMLYDKSCSAYYLDKVSKDIEYVKIASYLETLNIYTTGENVKNIWSNLKKEFRRQYYLQKQRETSGSGLESHSEWKYYELMLFLKNQVEPRATLTTLKKENLVSIEKDHRNDSIWSKSYSQENVTNHTINNVKEIVPPTANFLKKKQKNECAHTINTLQSLEKTINDRANDMLNIFKTSNDSSAERNMYIDEYISLITEDMESLSEDNKKECFITLLEEIHKAASE